MSESTEGDSLDPEDFYLENGYVVFTAAFHKKRGYCCGSGCRNCPFGNSAAQRSSTRDHRPDVAEDAG